MSEARNQESPLVQFYKRARPSPPSANAGVHLSERPFWGHLNLRGDSRNETFIEAVHSALAVALPVTPNTSCIVSDVAALWLGPDEFLILTPPGEETKALNRLQPRLLDHHHALTDLTSGQTIIHLSGKHVTDLLAKGCSVDLDARAFRAGNCVQTHLAKANVLIWQPHESRNFEVIVRRSFAEYLALWIEDAAQEFGFFFYPHGSIEQTEEQLFLTGLSPAK